MPLDPDDPLTIAGRYLDDDHVPHASDPEEERQLIETLQPPPTPGVGLTKGLKALAGGWLPHGNVVSRSLHSMSETLPSGENRGVLSYFDPLNMAKGVTHAWGNWAQGEVDPGDVLSPPGIGLAAAGPGKFFANAKRSALPGLAMDEASRLARAKEQGYGQTWWHGSAYAPFDEFNPMEPGTFFSSDKPYADSYADVYHPAVGDRPEPIKREADPYRVRGPIKQVDIPRMHPEREADWMDQQLEQGKQEGFSGVRFMRNGQEEEMVVPSGLENRIRRPDAAFDPARMDSKNLLAANNRRVAAPGLILDADGTIRARPGQTVTNPYREPLYPGVYGNPKEIAAEAASRAAPESEALGKVFGTSREELADINQHGTRQGNVDPASYLKLSPNPRGSENAAKVMNPRNAQRLIDLGAEAERHPLLRDMDNWYVMDPLYQHMVQMFGPDEGAQRFRFLQSMMGMASPNSEVIDEIKRGLLAHHLAHQGRFEDFVKYGGLGKYNPKYPDAPYLEQIGISGVPGHRSHSTSQAGPMARYMESGNLGQSMQSPKVPNYIMAHGVPETGFQTSHAVPDAHWSRILGLPDARRGPSDLTSSASMPEMQDLWPWWQREVARPLGVEPVPSQARMWGAGSGQTGVTSPIGPSKLELFADHVMRTAKRLGVSPTTARDMILNGTAYHEGGHVNDDDDDEDDRDHRGSRRSEQSHST